MRAWERTANWPAYAACVVAAVYAVVSFYWAFGGTAGIGTLGGRLEELGRIGDRAALWWHVLVWDLWFLVWGVLLGVAAWRFGRLSAAVAGGRRAGG